MKITITRAGGLIGSHLVRHFEPVHDVLPLKHRDLDITDFGAVRQRALREKPSLIINCATMEVDDCERDPKRAEAMHVGGPRAIAQVADGIGADVIHFSTNYVFDGDEIGRPPYTIHDEPRPVSVYGKAKWAGERAVLEACSRAYVIRTSWVYGAGKETFICKVHRGLLAGKQLRAISEVWASTTYVLDLVGQSEQMLKRGRYGTYHLVNDGVVSNYEFALEAGRLVSLSESQLKNLVVATKEEEAGRLVPRPRYTPMRSCFRSKSVSRRCAAGAPRSRTTFEADAVRAAAMKGEIVYASGPNFVSQGKSPWLRQGGGRRGLPHDGRDHQCPAAG